MVLKGFVQAVSGVCRGVLMSSSVGSQVQSQAGKTAEWVTFGMTVMLQVQDPLDGSVINVAEGKSHFQLRQTKAQKTTMSEDDILQMFRDAIRQASQDTLNALETRLKKLAERERATLTVRATEDPALVEIDGVLVGSTPLESLNVYAGDHVIRISRPGYQSFTKRLVLNSNTEITVPMLRTDVTAEERVKILNSAEMKVFMQNERPDVLIQEIK